MPSFINLRPSLLRVSLPEISHSCFRCGLPLTAYLASLWCWELAHKRLTASDHENSVAASATTTTTTTTISSSQGKTLDWRQCLLGDGLLGTFTCLQEKSAATDVVTMRRCGHSWRLLLCTLKIKSLGRGRFPPTVPQSIFPLCDWLKIGLLGGFKPLGAET